MKRYASVIVDLSADQVDQNYTYSIPDGINVSPGQRVMVPFGPRKLEGFVTDVTGEVDIDPKRIKPIMRTLEDEPLILPELMQLSLWMRKTYRCTQAAALRLMIPAQLRGERISVKTVNIARLIVDEHTACDECEKRKKAKRQVELITLLMGGERSMPELAEMVPGAQGVLRTLESQGIVSIERQAVLRNPHTQPPSRDRKDPELTTAQSLCVEQAVEAMDARGGRFLLSGVTGSGKTEIYIRLVRHALAMGKSAIVLVPEIALTPQMTDWFRARFGEGAAVLHSRLSPGERYDEWRRIRSGQARVVIGARSAVFAPMENIGLIVVDEEHEHTYLSDKYPCYDARDVAKKRVELSRGVLLLASATPSIASFMKCMPGVRPENKLTLLELNERVFGRPMPEVELVNMCDEIAKGNPSMFSASLQEALTDCLNATQQAMLLINRRGHSTFVSCRACGYVEKCDACDVSMTFHQAENLLRCHYCGAEHVPPTKCPNCGSSYIKYFGAGTQKVEQEVKKYWPKARVLRMDMDTTRTKGAHEKILTEFRLGHADVLIGTQMIAKGLDFPNVTLVGVVAADMSLNLPDYRSAERTFQLITQVAGRAGRANLPGRVIVQTYEPDHYAIELASRQDYRAFYQHEAKMRRRALYPPFTVLARLLISAKDSEWAQDAAQSLEAQLKAFVEENGLEEQVISLRSVEAPIGKLRGEARWQVFIKLYAKPESDIVLGEMESMARETIDHVRVELEINPTNMF